MHFPSITWRTHHCSRTLFTPHHPRSSPVQYRIHSPCHPILVAIVTHCSTRVSVLASLLCPTCSLLPALCIRSPGSCMPIADGRYAYIFRT
ncbi:hypothetical protein OH77DRAFT_303426 [Trametes cingulata]|nr:hypothetical protein OH77DRAFT_303426 [Trametes cingulata]